MQKQSGILLDFGLLKNMIHWGSKFWTSLVFEWLILAGTRHLKTGTFD
jgi:hypothetical protein